MIVQSPYHDANLSLTIGEGDRGILDTLTVMAATVDDAVAGGGPVHRIANALAADWGQNRARQLYGIYEFLKDAVVFKPDPRFLEHVRHPDQIAAEILADGKASGDCDDRASIGAALVRLMGFVPVLIVVSIRPTGAFHHVLFGALLDSGRVVTIDPQEKMFAKLPDTMTRSLVFTWPAGPFVNEQLYGEVSAWLRTVRGRRADSLDGMIPTVTRLVR